MGFFDKIRNAFSGTGEFADESEFIEVIDSTYREYAATSEHFWWSPEVNTTSVWKERVKNWPDNKKISFILWMLPLIHKANAGKRNWSSDDKDLKLSNTKQAFIQTLFRNKLEMDDDDAIKIFENFIRYRTSDWANLAHWPINLMLNQLEKQRKGKDISAPLKAMLERVKESISVITAAYQEKERIKMVDKIDSMLFRHENEATGIKPARFLGEDAFAEYANRAVEDMPESEKLLWYALLPIAQKATGSKPSKKFLDDTKAIIKEINSEIYKKKIHGWLQFLVDLKVKEEEHTVNYENGYSYTYTSYDYLTSVNADAVKGLVWTCSHFHDNTTIQTISALAERAFKKIPGKGPTAASVGNACLYVLYKSRGLDGIGQLSRLKTRIKQNSTQRLIEKYLESAAGEQGVTISEIEDMAVDDCDLIDGKRSYELDEFKAELEITGVGKTELRWFKPGGLRQKSVPATVKGKHAAKLKKIKGTAKQIEQTLTAQRDRIDKMFRDERKMGWEKFQQYYFNHGLLSWLTKRIIWNFHMAGKTVQAIYLNGHWINETNQIIDVSNTGQVSLWHPVQASLEQIRTWREFLVTHQLLQPLKQAYREVYLLTDAELNTKSYSNRMAAHILRQHQFNSLAKTRSWRYALMGGFDNGYDNGRALLELPEYKLRAEYWVNEVNADGAMNETGIWTYISTDQVRFISAVNNEVVDLVDVPPLAFSEVMRDVDLFVGVASVGNDPTWQDSGGLPAYRDYWTSYSFGELSELAKSRKEILGNLVPRLKIRDVAIIKDKFLVVRGKLRTYKIHIGSTNILMEPNDQYLCIVPDRSQKDHTENVFLPFEGDTGLSIILSKAFLLADDDKIKDPTITSQIKRK